MFNRGKVTLARKNVQHALTKTANKFQYFLYHAENNTNL